MSANGGRKARRISPEDFLEMLIPSPPLPEQQKIAEILTAQDEVIALLQKRIELKQQQKKYLMQKLLSGEVRREQLPSPVLWAAESHGLYSQWGHEESDMTNFRL